MSEPQNPSSMRPRQVFLVRDREPIQPMGEAACQALLLGSTLGATMQARLSEAGLAISYVDTREEAFERARKEPFGALVTFDSLACSASVLRSLLDAPGSARAALPDALRTRALSHIGGLDPVSIDNRPAFAAPLWIVRPDASAHAKSELPLFLLPYEEIEWKLPAPPAMLGQAKVSIGATGTYAIRVGHWAHILWLNQAALIAGWFEGRHTFSAKLWFLWRLLLGFPWRRGRLAAALCHIHRHAKVHHSAHVELSIVEEGADIGAHAVVKNSWIGRGARIEDGAIVNGCVVGEGAFVAAASSILGCVLSPVALAA